MIDYSIFIQKMRELGMDYKWASTFASRLKEDEENFSVSEDERQWALERGFYPGRVELLGLTDENYHDFLSDYHYSMMHPYNNHFLKWLDKLTLKYILNSDACKDLMPEYYVYVENEKCGGKFTYLMDCPLDIPRNKDFLWNLLKTKRILAMKPNSGTSGGKGFIKLELRDKTIYENNKPITFGQFEEIRDTMRNYVITEYVHQHSELAKIWSGSECTLRVIMCKNPAEDRFMPATWSCMVSYARFGTRIGGGASNLSSGGIGIGFDFGTGELQDLAVQYRKYTKDGQWLLKRHPDTNVLWKGFILPNWTYVKKKIEILCQHISSLDYLGLDIIITEDGMKICEINSLPSVDYEQIISGPVLRKKYIRDFFESKGLSSIDASQLYKAYQDSLK